MSIFMSTHHCWSIQPQLRQPTAARQSAPRWPVGRTRERVPAAAKHRSVLSTDISLSDQEQTPSGRVSNCVCLSISMNAAESSLDVGTTLDDSLSEELEKEVQETRKMVSALQALLLQGSLPEEEEEEDVSLHVDQCDPEQQLTVVRSRLDQSMEEVQELKREVLRCKQELRTLQGVKVAQQQRLCSQESSILQMKQELLRASMSRDELNNQKAELQWKLEESNRLWTECKKEVGQKERLLQQLRLRLEESQKQQTDLQRELENKTNLLQGLMGRDLQQTPPSTDINSGGSPHSGAPAVSLSDAEEVQLLRDSLESLRNNFRDHAPQHHTLDTLEQGIVSLMDRLQVLHAHRGRVSSPRRKGQRSDHDPWSCTSEFCPRPRPAHAPDVYFHYKH
uniref:Dixin n=1 Tax=Cynoglossus semilaevis TaxID=244447 RepID=A0A3P8V9V4_CYNSE